MEFNFQLPSEDEINRRLLAQAEEMMPKLKPFFVENWPGSIKALSMQTHILQMSAEEQNIIIDAIKRESEKRIKSKEWELIGKIDAIIDSFNNAAFFRLGSRSPKDNFSARGPYGIPVPVHNGRQAWEYMMSSERVYLDLSDAARVDYLSTICIRKWLNRRWDQEFRCFVEDGRLVGITQYYLEPGYSQWIENNSEIIRERIKNYVSFVVIPLFGQENFSVDLMIDDEFGIVLMELNPPFSSGITFTGLYRDRCFGEIFRFVGRQDTNVRGGADG